MNPEDIDTSEPVEETDEESCEEKGETRQDNGLSERDRALLEALLFVSEQPLSLDRLVTLMETCSRDEIRRLLDALNTDYEERQRAFEIVEVSGGYQVRTRPEFAPYLARLQPQRPQRLSRAALESLAIIAYRQPVTRAEVEAIRGVDTGAVIGSLLEKRLVRILGRKEVPGRPMLYGSSPEFLEVFGLKNLASLPTLREIDSMFESEMSEAEMDPLPPGDDTAPEVVAPGQEAPSAEGEGDEHNENMDEPENGEEDEFLEESGLEDPVDMETAELDAELRAVSVRVQSYDEAMAAEAAENGDQGEPSEGNEEENSGDGEPEDDAKREEA